MRCDRASADRKCDSIMQSGENCQIKLSGSRNDFGSSSAYLVALARFFCYTYEMSKNAPATEI